MSATVGSPAAAAQNANPAIRPTCGRESATVSGWQTATGAHYAVVAGGEGAACDWVANGDRAGEAVREAVGPWSRPPRSSP